MIFKVALHSFARLVSEKEWHNRKYTSDEIVDILMNNNPSIINNSQRDPNIEKIQGVLIELKKLQDPRYVNIITCRKIEKTEKKFSKFYFHDKFKLCCPKGNEKLWEKTIEYFEENEEEESASDFSDHFDWATDESDSEEDKEYWDYIVPEIKLAKNFSFSNL